MAMTENRPLKTLKYAEKEVDRYKEDVEDWKQDHDDLSKDCWLWEDIAAKADFVFHRIILLDQDVREAEFSGKFSRQGSFVDFDRRLTDLLRGWVEVSAQTEPHVVRLASVYCRVDGGHEFLSNLAEARAILTPDNDFFNHDKLIEMRDCSVDTLRSGLAEPMFDDVCVESKCRTSEFKQQFDRLPARIQSLRRQPIGSSASIRLTHPFDCMHSMTTVEVGTALVVSRLLWRCSTERFI